MPTYCHICPSCGQTTETVCSVHGCHDRVCECGASMNRDYGAERPNIGDREYRKPIVSHSLAVSPQQVAGHRQAFPDIKITNDGCPVFESYRQHDAYLKRIGAVKNRQRIRNRGKRIATGAK